MRLIIVHNHFRPGGVRRVIEMATPHLVAHPSQRLTSVIILSGEPVDPSWRSHVETLLRPVPLDVYVHPCMLYLTEHRATKPARQQQLSIFLRNHLSPAHEAVIWAHNQSLARNYFLTRTLLSLCKSTRTRLILHHHDWWFDNRWDRWQELRRHGIRSLNDMAATLLSSQSGTHHVVINQMDAAQLRPTLGRRIHWLPNLSERHSQPSDQDVNRATAWLKRTCHAKGPFWLLPCRLLRRKNIAEAFLLTRWLLPDAHLVTTGGVSSANENIYARRLASAATRHKWPLHLAVLGDAPRNAPAVNALMAASDVVLLTSLQEGFGLPYLEASAASRPLIARRLSNIAPDLADFGFRFPHAYDEIHIAKDLLDWKAERTRQLRLFEAWRATIPRIYRDRLTCPPWLSDQISSCNTVPFSRLTLTAQLEFLSIPSDISWTQCLPFNTPLERWRQLAESGKLKVTPWPRTARERLGGRTYADSFHAILQSPRQPALSQSAARVCQDEFVRQRLEHPFLYPLLWSPTT